jgi:hypothetical protein
MTRNQRIVGTVIFSGDFDSDVEGAAAELSRHGIKCFRMPEKFRPLLYLPRDDFMEVSIEVSSTDWNELSDAEQNNIVNEFWQEVRTIVGPYGADADSFGPATADSISFEDVFDRKLLVDDEALQAEIDKIENEMMCGVERARAWGRL